MLTLLAAVSITAVSAMAAELPSSSDTAIHAALASGRPTVADFVARTCIPCKKMALGIAQNYRVQMVPTQIFFDT